MGWRLDIEATAAEEVARLLRDQSQAATEALSGEDRAKGVHEARKASKRCRALLRAARPGWPAEAWREAFDRYRDAARAIATARDAAVRLQTFDGLADGRWPAVREALLAAVAAEAHAPVGVGDALLAFATPVEVPEGLRRRHLVAGVGALYRRARAERPATLDAPPAAFHEWRKRVKDHLYHLQLLAPAWPEVLDPWADAVDGVAEALGAHQDLCVLQEWLVAAAHDVPELHDTLSACAAARRKEALDAAARPLGLRGRVFEAWIADIVR